MAAADRLPSAELPFDGLKVVDCSWVVVGPSVAKHFADHGATTVRLETTAPMDTLRVAMPFKDAVPDPDRGHFFGEFNTSKLGMTLDLKTPAGVGVAHRLLAWADAFIEAFTPGTVDRLGIGYEKARSINPSIIMLSTCLMGQTGPLAGLSGFGYHAASIAGFYEVTGWQDLPPDGPWLAYTDTIGPHFLSATVMAALDHRSRTGQGQHIDASQLEMALHFLSPQTLDSRLNGRTVTRDGNRSPTAAPQGAYPCLGDDRWCAIAVENDEQWVGLRRALGDPNWARDERYETTEGRLTHHDEIDRELSAWTSGKEEREVMGLLLSEGGPGRSHAAQQRPTPGPATGPPGVLPQLRPCGDGQHSVQRPAVPHSGLRERPPFRRPANGTAQRIRAQGVAWNVRRGDNRRGGRRGPGLGGWPVVKTGHGNGSQNHSETHDRHRRCTPNTASGMCLVLRVEPCHR